MYPYYNKRPLVENCVIINVSSFLRRFLDEKKKNLFIDNEKKIVIKDENLAKRIVNLANNFALYLKMTTNGKTEETEKNRIKLTYTISNLKRGFIFWFVCNGCSKKVRFLYFAPFSEKLLCRECHRLSYEKQNKRKDRLVKSLLANHELRLACLLSPNLKENIAALEAETILKRMREEVNKNVDKKLKKVNNLISAQV